MREKSGPPKNTKTVSHGKVRASEREKLEEEAKCELLRLAGAFDCFPPLIMFTRRIFMGGGEVTDEKYVCFSQNIFVV